MRKTHVERRTETIHALTTATINSLLANGYVGTSARGVAEAAGVSQGALQYHFRNKAELVDRSLSGYLEAALGDLLGTDFAGRSELERAAELLDRLWTFHRLPIFDAAFELLAIAKRDPEAGQLVGRTVADLVDQMERAACVALPRVSQRSGFPKRLQAAINAVRGAALIANLQDSRRATWSQLRAELAAGLVGE